MSGVTQPVQESLFDLVQQRHSPRLVRSGDALPEAIATEIGALQDGDPLREVVIVTPPGPTADTIRRRLPRCNQGRGAAGIRFLTPVDLASELLERAGTALRPLTPQVVAGLVERQLERQCPAELVDVRQHPATVDALVDLTERTRHVPARPHVWSALAGGSTTRQALLSVAAQARADLRAAGFADEAATLVSATTSIDRLGSSTAVVVALAEPFHPGQLNFVTELVAHTESRVIAVAAWADDADLQRQVATICAIDVDNVVRLWASASDALPWPAALVSAPDQDEECRANVRRVVELSTDPAGPIRLDRIAVLCPPSGGYHRSITDELDRAHVPWSGPTPHTLAESIGGTVTRLLIEALEQPDRLRMFNLFGIAQHRTRTDEARRNVDGWRRVARRAGIVTADDWATAAPRLDKVHEAERARRLQHYGEPPDERSQRREQRERDDMAAMLTLVNRIRGIRGGLFRATTWTTAVDELVGALELLIGNDLWRERRWAELAQWQHKAATQIIDGLRSLVVLDEPSIELPYSWPAMRRIVTDLLDKRVGRQNSSTPGVRVHPLTDGACIDADVVLVVGANDGVLPGRPNDDLIVPRNADEPSAVWIEHAYWSINRATRAWSSVLRGSARVEVSRSRSDMRRGGDLYPSRLLPAELIDPPQAPMEQTATIVRSIDSHAAQVRTGRALTTAELLTRDGDAWKRSTRLRRRARSGISRRLSVPAEYDGMIGTRPELDVGQRPLAITALENLATCGISYFLNTVLRVRQEDDPAETEKLAATDKGRMIHAVLEDVVRGWLAADGPYLDDVHYPQAVATLAERLDQHAELLAESGLLGHPVRWTAERDLLVDGLTQVLDSERLDGCLPVAVEHRFGMDSADDSLVVDTSVGRVRFRGLIDRIDHVDGRARVTDFKSTNSVNPQAPSKHDPTSGGTKLQLHLYSIVADRDHGVDGGYVSVRYVYIRNHVVTPKPVELDQAAAVAWVDELASRIVHGEFYPGEPHGSWGCRDCSPDGLGLETLGGRAARFAALAAERRAEAQVADEDEDDR